MDHRGTSELAQRLLAAPPSFQAPGRVSRRRQVTPAFIFGLVSLAAAILLVVDLVRQENGEFQSDFSDLFDRDTLHVVLDLLLLVISVACFVISVISFFFGLGPVHERLQDYTMVSKLGDGGYGDVYHAKDKETECDVALKFVSVGGKGDRFDEAIQESLKLVTCRHQNVVMLLDMFMYFKGASFWTRLFFGESPWSLCLVLEYCDGGDLSSEIKRWAGLPAHKFPSTRTVLAKYVSKIAYGLDHMHLKGVAHLDLKPGNIFISNGGRQVKIGDLGLAEKLTGGKIRVAVGTPGYMAPEVWQMENAQSAKVCRTDLGYSARADVWSLGCILADLMLPNVDEVTHEGGWTIVAQVRRYLISQGGHVPEEMMENGDIWFGFGRRGKYQEVIDILMKQLHSQRAVDDKGEFATIINIIQGCLHPNPEERMSTKNVLTNIELVVPKDAPKTIRVSSAF